LGAGLEHKLGLSSQQWDTFWHQLTPQQQQIFELKTACQSDSLISKAVQCTPKQLQKRWTQMLELAWSIRNGHAESKSN
jgi:pyoverdine/dityrosine biosynthesis protein Dit1